MVGTFFISLHLGQYIFKQHSIDRTRAADVHSTEFKILASSSSSFTGKAKDPITRRKSWPKKFRRREANKHFKTPGTVVY
jgi:hypothetical protein